MVKMNLDMCFYYIILRRLQSIIQLSVAMTYVVREAQAGMKLDKYVSNSEVVTDMVLPEFDSKYSGQDVLKVLGLKWLA